MVGGIRPSAGVVLPLPPPALLHYTINRRKLQAVRQKICAKKVEMLGGCALRGTGSTCRPCPRRGGRGVAAPLAALGFPAPGERTISNAEVPLPRSPLSLAAGTAHRKGGSFGFAPHRRLLARGARMAETVSVANGLMQGCRGRSPRRNKLIVSPFPTGEGGRGDRGQESIPKARLAGGKQGEPPPGTTAAGAASTAGVQPPRRAPQRRGQQVPPPAQARGCKGRSPLHKITLKLPLPHRGRGAGG